MRQFAIVAASMVVLVGPLACGDDTASSDGCVEGPGEGDFRPESLEELMAIPPYRSLEGGFAIDEGIDGLVSLQDVPLLACLEQAEFVGLRRTALVNLNGLGRLRQVEQVFIRDNPSLVTLEGLDSLERVLSRVQVDDNPSLTTIGLNSLKEVPIIEIGSGWPAHPMSDDPTDCARLGNDALRTIDGFAALRGFERIEIFGNASLESVDAFRAIAAEAYLVPLPDSMRVNPPERPFVHFFGNTSLSPAHLEDVWSGVGPDGAELIACDNKDDPCGMCETW